MKHYIIPIFIPHLGCRHQCIFCNQQSITGRPTPVTARQVRTMIADRLAAFKQKRQVEVAFYGGSFTALPEAMQNELLAPATEARLQGHIQGIRLSTRPDCINEPIVNNLLERGVTVVELGVQSLDDTVLAAAARGHDCKSVAQAVTLLKKTSLRCGLQFMPGLPGEDWLSLLKTVQRALALSPDFVRIYPAVVIQGTPLAGLYQRGAYQPLSLPQATVRSAYMKLAFERRGIAVIRVGLQASAELDREGTVLAGPYHPAFGELVDAHIFYLMLAGFVEQGIAGCQEHLLIRHHPQDCSKVRGHYNNNIAGLQQAYNIAKITLQAEALVPRATLLFTCGGQDYLLNKNMINSI
ncbi:ELP3: radical SAM enzyme/protein acetyltransferase, ELP3 family [Sporomusa termitida]|uniref:ELP3: radical SAM enzyme/protein acetyltransferase, ELP3 family n=2 Tax=Sporomusa termitida TaxID=2377 RepID=A0A517DSV1_9FIRM|nr:ELP3: radical SAM enzyme/protein acetyltransferase, ELP3 family [Sporomusa termitida]